MVREKRARKVWTPEKVAEECSICVLPFRE